MPLEVMPRSITKLCNSEPTSLLDVCNVSRVNLIVSKPELPTLAFRSSCTGSIHHSSLTDVFPDASVVRLGIHQSGLNVESAAGRLGHMRPLVEWQSTDQHHAEVYTPRSIAIQVVAAFGQDGLPLTLR
jgi:hypothetical protein